MMCWFEYKTWEVSILIALQVANMQVDIPLPFPKVGLSDLGERSKSQIIARSSIGSLKSGPD